MRIEYTQEDSVKMSYCFICECYEQGHVYYSTMVRLDMFRPTFSMAYGGYTDKKIRIGYLCYRCARELSELYGNSFDIEIPEHIKNPQVHRFIKIAKRKKERI